MNYKKTDLTHKTITTFLQGFSETISVSSNDSREWQDQEWKTCDQCWSPSNIVDWSKMIIDENKKTLLKVPPLIPTFFEKDIISGMSTNEFLVVKGLIDPRLYVWYMHLELFLQYDHVVNIDDNCHFNFNYPYLLPTSQEEACVPTC